MAGTKMDKIRAAANIPTTIFWVFLRMSALPLFVCVSAFNAAAPARAAHLRSSPALYTCRNLRIAKAEPPPPISAPASRKLPNTFQTILWNGMTARKDSAFASTIALQTKE